MFSAPRVWWTLQAFGHWNVGVLNGGLPAWKRDGGQLETGPPREYKIRKYPVPELNESLVRSFKQVTELVERPDTSVRIIDARSTERFQSFHLHPNGFQISWHCTGAPPGFGQKLSLVTYE
jgi:thiosulfate/3-mercaptopyruvate sulfurtransferase